MADSVADQELNDSSSIRKEPSCSRWCGENEAPTDAAAAAEEESEQIDLPLLRGSGSDSDRRISHVESPRSSEFWQRSMSGKAYVPLDIENGIRSSVSMDKLDSLESSSSSLKPFSAFMVMKTLLFVLVWYTFSTCLILYNKTLLGDDLGKFPAPLLMNTVHFAMQAILSHIIIFIQSRCFESGEEGPEMTWRDYFLKDIKSYINHIQTMAAR